MKYLEIKGRIEGEYAEFFDRAEIYSLSLGMDTETHDEMMMDLADTVLTAQKKGRPLGEITGESEEEFFRSYFSGFDWRDRVKAMLKNFFPVVCVMLVIEIIAVIIASRAKDFDFMLMTYRIDAGGYLVGIFAGLFVVGAVDAFVRNAIVKGKKVKFWVYMLIMLAVIVATGVVAALMKPISVPALPVMIIEVLLIAAYIVMRVVEKKKSRTDTIDLKKLEREFKRENREKTTVFELCRQYEKECEKKLKKGKKIRTPQEFTDDIERLGMIGLIGDIIVGTFMVGTIVGMMIPTAMESSIGDALLMGLLTLVITAPFLLLFIWPFVQASAMQRSIAKKCRKHGVDIVEYKRMLEEQEKTAEQCD